MAKPQKRESQFQEPVQSFDVHIQYDFIDAPLSKL